MKKYSKYLMAAMLVAVMLLLVACNPAVGEFKLKSASLGSLTAELGSDVDESSFSGSLSIKNDKTFTFNVNISVLGMKLNESESGYWSSENDTIKFYSDAEMTKQVLTATLVDGNIVFNIGGIKVTFAK